MDSHSFCICYYMGYDERDLYKIIHYAIILIGQKIKEYELKEYEEQMQIDSD